MGFYGNITNTSRTQFQFDKRYSNRRAMDTAAALDGVFIGRYVLVEYDTDSDLGVDRYTPVYRDADKRFYSSYNAETITEVKISDSIKAGTIVRVPAGRDKFGQYYNLENPLTDEEELWQCNNSNAENIPGKIATFTLLSRSSDSNYVKNYAIDTEYYGKGRGYDSTVWQKVYLDGAEKYVMVAELNTVVPTFDISADAPTMSPVTPHFDTDSTNVYYKLHWQPQWGFRIKCAEGDLRGPLLGTSGENLVGLADMSTDERDYPSDETTQWKRTGYNRVSGVGTDYLFLYTEDSNIGNWVSTKSGVEVHPAPAAIYYNKAGFASDTVTYSSDKEYEGWDDNSYHVYDEIQLTPSGQSGASYPLHDGTTIKEPAPDTQELSIMLPSLGDSMAKIWDLVYGDREVNADYNEQLGNNKTDEDGNVILGSKRNRNIQWQNANAVDDRDGLRLVHRTSNRDYTYSVDEVDTLAGVLNSVHDLMGMIITGGKDANGEDTIVWGEDGSDDQQVLIDTLNKEYIYYKDGKYYRKHKTYEYEPAPEGVTETYTPVELQAWEDRVGDYYFIDSDSTEKPGYILDQEFHPDRAYVKDLQTEEIHLGAGYEPYKYYTLDYKTLNGGKFKVYSIETNSNYDIDTLYYSIIKETNISYQRTYFYGANTYYYIENDKYVLDDSDIMSTRRQYYILVNKTYEPVSVLDPGIYKPGKYYISSGDGYTLESDTAEFNISTSYYTKYCLYYPGKYYYAMYSPVKVSEKEFKSGTYYVAYELSTNGEVVIDGKLADPANYNPNTTYYELKYIKDNALSPTAPYYHYSISTKPSSSGETTSYYIQTYTPSEPLTLTEDTYKPGFYYKLINGKYVLDEDDFSPDVAGGTTGTYYTMTVTLEQVTDTDVIDIDTAERVNLLSLDSGEYYYKEYDKATKTYQYKQVNNYNYSPLSNARNVFYRIELETLMTIYSPNTYYYRYELPDKAPGEERNGSYLLSLNDYSKDRTYYYKISGTPVGNTYFYAPYKYYYKSASGEYILATNSTYGKDNSGNDLNELVYYNRNSLYVISDALDVYYKGARWNPNAPCPDTVVLGTRTPKWELQELKEFAYHFNTIHGLILKIHELLEDGDGLTRDQTNVQGAINLLNDMVAQFSSMIPGQFTIVDEYGRLHSSAYTTKQEYSTKNEQTSITEDNAIEATEDRFLDIDIDDSALEPKITLYHNFTVASDTTTVSDKNSALTSAAGYTALGNNNSFGDTLNLYSPIVDNMGHVVGKNTETVTLPYGYKFFNIGAQSSSVGNGASVAGTMAADNTQDTLSINSSNKWIRLSATEKVDADGHDTLTIGHEVHTINTANKTATDLNNNTDTITLQDILFDEAGHATANQNHTYTLPYGFKTFTAGNSTGVTGVTGNTSSVIAANTQDQITLTAGNKWINVAGSQANKSLTFGHSLSALAAGEHSNSQTSLTPSFGASFNIPIVTSDEAGHLIGFKTETIKIPQGSLTNAVEKSTSNAITSLDFVPSTGALTVGRTNIGDLIITGYSKPTSVSATISATDSLNTALGKLKFEIDKEISDRGQAVQAEAEARQQADQAEATTRQQADQAETEARQQADQAEATARAEAITQEVADRNEAIVNAINALDVEDTEVNNQYVSGVSETDGIISVSRKTLLAQDVVADEEQAPNTFITGVTVNENGSLNFTTGGIKDETYAPYSADYVMKDTEFVFDETNSETVTIEGLILKIKELQAENQALAARVTALEPSPTP